MSNSTSTQDPAIFNTAQEEKIQKLFSAELKKHTDKAYKNTTIIVSTCIVITLMVVVFSMLYMAQLKSSMIIDIKEAVKNISSSTAETTIHRDSAAPSNAITEHSVSVELESANLLSADYLAIVLSIIISLAGAYVVFLGMNRLKMYDERIDSNRSDLLKELNTMVINQVSAGQAQQLDSFKAKFDSNISDFNDSVATAKNELDILKQKHLDDIEQAGSGFNWLKATLENKDIDLNLQTVSDSHKLVEKLHNERPKNYIAQIQEVVRRVCDYTLSGDVADYHNLSAELARGNMYKEAIDVLKKGTNLFPKDADLLADIIQYATKCGMLEEAKAAYIDLNDESVKKSWSWRGYSFTSDYYRAQGDYEKALKMCNEAIEVFPNDEHAYHDKAELLRIIHRNQAGIDESIKTLQEALDRNINCPACALMLGLTYADAGQYVAAINCYNRAIQELAQDQPHTSDAVVFFNRAICYDRIFMQSNHSNSTKLDFAIQAFKDYRVALALGELGDFSIVNQQQAIHRLTILSQYIPANILKQFESDSDTAEQKKLPKTFFKQLFKSSR
ncbi:MAG: tetratricopeptide repeat protein [Oscillospiraceae bacterium]|nr:tetratricopeptide repeat protein [Oscillospiraceae bacterium]MBQ7130670.1 tetratricopeptide repeat protein [Oscillospiraceae bacterium]